MEMDSKKKIYEEVWILQLSYYPYSFSWFLSTTYATAEEAREIQAGSLKPEYCINCPAATLSAAVVPPLTPSIITIAVVLLLLLPEISEVYRNKPRRTPTYWKSRIYSLQAMKNDLKKKKKKKNMHKNIKTFDFFD